MTNKLLFYDCCYRWFQFGATNQQPSFGFKNRLTDTVLYYDCNDNFNNKYGWLFCTRISNHDSDFSSFYDFDDDKDLAPNFIIDYWVNTY